MFKTKVLIIDDDEKLNRLLVDYFIKFEINLISASHPREGLQRLSRENPDLLILDVMLPETDGFQLCRKVRETHPLPIIMLTARGELSDKVVGLESGADDYLAKPFEPRELVARVQALLRRRPAARGETLRSRDLVLEMSRRKAILKGKTLELTTMELEALKIFMERPGLVMNRDQILERLGEVPWDSLNRSVDVLVSRLRQKLGDDPKNPVYLQTVWGSGYVFVGDEND